MKCLLHSRICTQAYCELVLGENEKNIFTRKSIGAITETDADFAPIMNVFLFLFDVLTWSVPSVQT